MGLEEFSRILLFPALGTKNELPMLSMSVKLAEHASGEGPQSLQDGPIASKYQKNIVFIK